MTLSVDKGITDQRIENVRAWAHARIGTLSGAEVIVAVCDEALAGRSCSTSGTFYLEGLSREQWITHCKEGWKRAVELEQSLTASERRLLHVIGVMRMGGYWAAVMSDTEILAQIDEDMP